MEEWKVDVRYLRSQLHSQVPLVSILPFQVSIVSCLWRVSVVGVIRTIISITGRWERQHITIRWRRVEYLETWKFHAFSPSWVHAKTIHPTILSEVKHIAHIHTWWKATHCPIFWAGNWGDIFAHTCCQFNILFGINSHWEFILGIECHVVQSG